MIAVIFFGGLGALLGVLLVLAEKKFAVEVDATALRIAELLPGGQCGQCGQAGCGQAAEAMARGELGPDCCPPGGAGVAAEIASILGVSCGSGSGPAQLAVIDDQRCNGCTRCLRACPFDAIVGASRCAHGVLAALCTGCRICVATCPNDCLTMTPRVAGHH